MRKNYNEQLARLNDSISEMTAVVGESISNASEALSGGDNQVLERAMNIEEEIDRMEKEIEALALKLILTQQPVAGDLRLLSASLKMITDMERIGDQTLDIADIAAHIKVQIPIPEAEYLREMADIAAGMISDTAAAFKERDADKARRVMDMDDAIDALFNKTRSALIERVRNTDEGEIIALDLMMAAKYFERIGDHAVNIAEWVIYSITGKKN